MKKSKLNPNYRFGEKTSNVKDVLMQLAPIAPAIELDIDYGEKWFNEIDQTAGVNLSFMYQNKAQIDTMRDFVRKFNQTQAKRYDRDYNVFFQPNGIVSRLYVHKQKLFHHFMKRFIEVDGMIAKVDGLTIKDKYDKETQKLVASKIDAMKKLYQQNCAQNNTLTTSIMYR